MSASENSGLQSKVPSFETKDQEPINLRRNRQNFAVMAGERHDRS